MLGESRSARRRPSGADTGSTSGRCRSIKPRVGGSPSASRTRTSPGRIGPEVCPCQRGMVFHSHYRLASHVLREPGRQDVTKSQCRMALELGSGPATPLGHQTRCLGRLRRQEPANGVDAGSLALAGRRSDLRPEKCAGQASALREGPAGRMMREACGRLCGHSTTGFQGVRGVSRVGGPGRGMCGKPA
jgi:hypothetical protein